MLLARGKSERLSCHTENARMRNGGRIAASWRVLNFDVNSLCYLAILDSLLMRCTR